MGKLKRFIYKYKLDVKPTTFLKVPAGYEILSIHEQNNDICLWALVDIDRPIIIETFYLIGTGQLFPWERAKTKFIETVQLNNGSFVVHVFKDIT
jgi:hypothetical protein